MSIDPQTIRKDFPTLQREVHDTRLVYLDSAASSQTPRSVLDAMNHYYEHLRSNVERGVYEISARATELYEQARTKVAGFVGAHAAEGVIFTKNVTEACNLVAYSFVRRRLGPDDALLVTEMEHHANFVPFWHASQDLGFELRAVPVKDGTQLDLDAARELLADGKVRFVAVSHASNVLGTINPVAEIIAMARAANPDVTVLVDGAQAVPHLQVDVAELDADFYGFTGHKMLGPTGVGVLVARPELLADMPPFLTGGSMIRDVRLDAVTWEAPPHKFEAGTPPIAEVIGLDAAIDYLTDVGMDEIRAHERELSAVFLDALADVEGLTIHGPTDPEQRFGAISFTLEGIHPHDVGQVLDRHGVCVRVGHHCAKPLLRTLGVNATVRASLYLYNDEDDLQPLLDGIEDAKELFAR
ncbi:MAG: SufS family cysteine desulfurase [Nitriliruptorales bacterium]|nr:SufS family cysteine desulfurase [Nitriliruptorales bacterium]